VSSLLHLTNKSSSRETLLVEADSHRKMLSHCLHLNRGPVQSCCSQLLDQIIAE